MARKGKKLKRSLDEREMRHRGNSLARHLAPSELRLLRRLTLAGRISFDFQVVLGFYIADFVFPTKMLIVELDGKSHNSSRQKTHDKRRDEYLQKIGFVVWRVPNTDVGSFDLDRVYQFEDRPGYTESVGLARKIYSECNPVRTKEETSAVFQHRAQALTESIQAKRLARKLVLVPRLIKRAVDSESGKNGAGGKG